MKHEKMLAMMTLLALGAWVSGNLSDGSFAEAAVKTEQSASGQSVGKNSVKANFDDVAKDHWAYPAIKKLAQDGLIEGYNGSFVGEKPMTRYEMAMLVSKAVDKMDQADAVDQQIIMKLSKEFNDEINGLKLRMGNVEHQVADHERKLKTHVEGDMSATMMFNSNKNYLVSGASNYGGLIRVRFISGDPWDDVYFYSEASTLMTYGQANEMSGSTIAFGQAYFKINKLLGMDSVRIGRSGGDCLGVGGPIDRPSNYDGVKFTKKIGATTVDLWTGNYLTVNTTGSYYWGYGDSLGHPNRMTTIQFAFDPSKAIHSTLGYWYNGNAVSNGGTAGAYINAGADAGYDGQKGVDASLRWKIGHGYNVLTEMTYATLDNPTGGLKKHPMGIAAMLYYTSDENRPGLFPNVAGFADWHNAGTYGWGIVYGSNDAGYGPQGLYNCVDFSVGGTGSPYSVGNNVNVLMLRYEYVVKKGVVASLNLAKAWVKDKSLRSDLSSDQLSGDSYIGMGLKVFF